MMEKKRLKEYQKTVTIYNKVTGKASEVEVTTAEACIKSGQFTKTKPK